MATVLEYAKRDVKPLAIEPYDREWRGRIRPFG